MMDIDAIRKKITGIDQCIHFNNAGVSFPDYTVFDEIQKYLNQEKIRDGYQLQFSKEARVEQVYGLIADLIHAEASEIAIVQSASTAIVKLLSAIPFEKDDRILTTPYEYGTNYLNYMWLRDHKGIHIDLIPMDENYALDLIKAEEMIQNSTRLISITHVPTSSGTVAPIQAIGTLAKKYDVLYLVDACQSVGQIPIDLEKIQCDFLCATSRKYMRGPRGYGFLYIRNSALHRLVPPVVNMIAAEWKGMHSYQYKPSARVFEEWERSFAVLKGFEEAVRRILELGMEFIWERIKELSEYFRNKLSELEEFKIQDKGPSLCGIVTFTHISKSTEYVQKKLLRANINTTIAYPFASFTDLAIKQVDAVNRVSIHFFNTKAEIDRCIEVLRKIQ